MKGRLLLVDDNEDYLDSTKDVMEVEGYEVETATRGEEAVKLAASQDFDLVIMDIKMPGMNGVESFMEMKKSKPDIKVIMCTAYIVEDLIRQALEQGAVAVLNKPFEISHLLSIIESARKQKNPGRILVADRDQDYADRLGEILKAQGHEVVVARDGKDAVVKAGECEFDLLLLDVRLPAIIGLEVYHRIRAMHPDMRAAIFIGTDHELDASIPQDLRQNQGIHCVQKPLDTIELLDLVGTIWSNARRHVRR